MRVQNKNMHIIDCTNITETIPKVKDVMIAVKAFETLIDPKPKMDAENSNVVAKLTLK